MRKRIVLILLIFFLTVTFNPVIPILYSQESLFRWIENSTKDQDEIIIESFRIMDFDQRIAAVDALSNRTERDFGFLIDELYYSKSYKKAEKEYLLYLILEKLFSGVETVSDTGEPFYLLCNDIANYQQPILRKKIMEKTNLISDAEGEKILLKEALFLEKQGKRDSYLDSEMIEECKIFIREAERIGTQILRDYIEIIYAAVRNL